MSIQDTLEQLAACLCAQIITDGSPGVCFCGVVPGESVALDYQGDCDDVCGMAWVRLTSVYPATVMGTPSVEPNNCAMGLGFDLELGVVRCSSLPDDQGNPPSAADLLGDTTLQVADMFSMRAAILCCGQASDWLLGLYTPIGPEGGVVGGTWAASSMEF